jgi:mercuric reductase
VSSSLSPGSQCFSSRSRRPNTDDIGLEAAGVAIDRNGEVKVDATLRTCMPHIFAAGDVIGGQHESQMATPVGARQGGIAAHNALNGNALRAFDGRVVPRAIFTDPQIGNVGMTEAEVIAAGHRCWCTTIPMDIVPRAGAIRDLRGMIKMVADAETNEVLGTMAEALKIAAIARTKDPRKPSCCAE